MDTPSPHSHSSSSPSPPPEDAVEAIMATASNTIESYTGSSSSTMKRRMGGLGGMGPKSRRREDLGMGSLASMGLSGTAGMRRGPMGGASREEVVDTQLVEQLRAEFGDPFDDRILTDA